MTSSVPPPSTGCFTPIFAETEGSRGIRVDASAAFYRFVLSVWSIGTYNKFVKYKNYIEATRSGINVAH